MRIDPHSIPCNRLRRAECLRAGGDHSAGHGSIDIVSARGRRVLVHDRRIVVIVYDSGANRSVRNIDALYIGAAHRIRRDVYLARSQREPPYLGPRNSTYPRDKGGSIDRSLISCLLRSLRRRHPRPCAFIVDPTSVMERSKSPRLLVDPRVPPRFNIIPMAIAIRSPVWFRHTREPQIPIIGTPAPRAIFIQVLVAYDVETYCFEREFSHRRSRLAAQASNWS